MKTPPTITILEARIGLACPQWGQAGTQRLVPLADLARELARAAKSHHHG